MHEHKSCKVYRNYVHTKWKLSLWGNKKKSLVRSVEREMSAIHLKGSEMSGKKPDLTSYRILWIPTLSNPMFFSFRKDFLITVFLCNFSKRGNLYFDFTSRFLHHIKWGHESFRVINLMFILRLWETVTFLSTVGYLPV